MNPVREWWWLVALEATLFLSISCWELTATWAEPVNYPLRFAAVVLGGATVAALAFHVGPAMLARRGVLNSARLGLFAVGLWLAAGYAERIVMAARVCVQLAYGLGRPAIVVAALATTLLACMWRDRLRRLMTYALLLTGAVLLVSALVTSWQGFQARSQRFIEDPPQWDWMILKGIILSAAPAIIVGWRIGRSAEHSRHIWYSGLAGIWLPITAAITVCSLARQAGVALTPGDSLARSSASAFVGLRALPPGVISNALAFTLLGPAVLSCICLKELSPNWRGLQRLWLIPLGAALLMVAAVANNFLPDGFWSEFATPAYQVWVVTVLVLGAIAAVAALALSRPVEDSR